MKIYLSGKYFEKTFILCIRNQFKKSPFRVIPMTVQPSNMFERQFLNQYFEEKPKTLSYLQTQCSYATAPLHSFCNLQTQIHLNSSKCLESLTC